MERDRMSGPTERSGRTLDVLIVGAGPAGVAAALTAQARGLSVAVVDKHSFPRDKTCGDGLTTGALRRLEELGIEMPKVTDYQRVGQVVLVSPSGRRVELPMPADGDHSAVVPRFALDAALVEHARANGVEIREGSTLTGLHVHGDHAHATLADGSELEARFVIAADGHWSTVRRLREPNRPHDLGAWHAVRQYFRGVADRRQWVLFTEELLPGYAWVFPLPDGRANVGFCVLRGDDLKGKQAADLWRTVLEHPWMREALGPAAEPEARTSAWPIPADFDPRRLSDGRVLYVGDAAGVVDPMTGEGIAQALETGMLAGAAIAEESARSEQDAPGVVGARYARDVKRTIGRDLRFARALQRVLHAPIGARAAIATAGLSGWTRRNFARWMFEDYPRASVLTPDRWKRGLFSAPGAFSGASPEPGRDGAGGA
jgi:menaquinone-9 beta-reductase